MLIKQNYHRAFGVYGLCFDGNQILAIHKTRGPYNNRYDLPGGSLQMGEGLLEALQREFKEETGLEIEVMKQIGVVDFKLPWRWREYTDVHHIAVFYQVDKKNNRIELLEFFDGQDSGGAEWVHIKKINQSNSSPLILKAVEWMENQELSLDTTSYAEWEIR